MKKLLLLLTTLLFATSCSDSMNFEELLEEYYKNTNNSQNSDFYTCPESSRLAELNLFVMNTNGDNLVDDIPLTEWNIDKTSYHDEPYYVDHSCVEIHQYIDNKNQELPFYNQDAKVLTIYKSSSDFGQNLTGKNCVRIRVMCNYGFALNPETPHNYKVRIKCKPLFGDEKMHDITFLLGRGKYTSGNFEGLFNNSFIFENVKLDETPTNPFYLENKEKDIKYEWGIKIVRP